MAAEAAKQWTAGFNPRRVEEGELLSLYQAAFDRLKFAFPTRHGMARNRGISMQIFWFGQIALVSMLLAAQGVAAEDRGAPACKTERAPAASKLIDLVPTSVESVFCTEASFNFKEEEKDGIDCFHV